MAGHFCALRGKKSGKHLDEGKPGLWYHKPIKASEPEPRRPDGENIKLQEDLHMEFKSKLTKCPRGHYYNSALHDQCPVCMEESNAGGGVIGGTMPVGDMSGGTMPVGDQVSGGAMPVGGGYAGSSFPGTKPVDGVSSPSADDGRTIIGEDMPADTTRDPVVGWLVCIEGGSVGQDFQLHAGYNYIGREEGDICIPDDKHISRQNHAMVAYDSSDNMYYVGPLAGRNLIKLNGKTIFSAAELKSYDVISIGTTKLIFVALCGEQFSWSRGTDNG